MRFTFEGVTYQMTFKRDAKPAPNPEWKAYRARGKSLAWLIEFGIPEFVPSKYPYTTVILDVVEPDLENPGRWKVVTPAWRTNTVGCWHREKKGFNPNKGRVRALHGINETIPAGMLKPMWAAYNERAGARSAKRQLPVNPDAIY